MGNVAVSVLVPVYNAEDYLVECMESLAHQTLKDIEVIAVDDGSTDKSGEILDLYARNFENFTVVHQECISQANALNRAVRMAKGEYVAECDADDFAALTMYEKLYKIANHEADVVRCGFFGCFPSGHLQPQYFPMKNKEFWCNPAELKGGDVSQVFGKMVILMAGIYKRSFILDNEIFWREDGQNYEDTLVSFKIRCRARDYRFLNDCLYYYRRENPNSGSETIKDEYAIIEQYDAIRKYNEQHGNEDIAAYMNVKMYYDYMWSLSRTPEDRRADFVYAMMDEFRAHPASRELFNNGEDFRTYCSIKYGDWTETGVKMP